MYFLKRNIHFSDQHQALDVVIGLRWKSKLNVERGEFYDQYPSGILGSAGKKT